MNNVNIYTSITRSMQKLLLGRFQSLSAVIGASVYVAGRYFARIVRDSEGCDCARAGQESGVAVFNSFCRQK